VARMGEAEWLGCTDPQRMLQFLRSSGRASDRKLRLFICACGRRLWPWLVQEASRQAVEVAERFAEGLAPVEHLAQAWRAASLAPPAGTPRWSQKQVAAHEVVVASVFFEAADVVSSVAAWAAQAAKGKQAERALLCDILRDLFGPLPFRPVTTEAIPRTPAVVALAASVGAQRSYELLPELAGALADAGCTDAHILSHCRGRGPHVRGCWVVDLLLGKA
jgi:hypothetical protein